MTILPFGVLKDVLGHAGAAMELPAGADVAALLRALPQADAPVWKSVAVAVNREYATLRTVLHEGDEVALLPPVSGGRR